MFKNPFPLLFPLLGFFGAFSGTFRHKTHVNHAVYKAVTGGGVASHVGGQGFESPHLHHGFQRVSSNGLTLFYLFPALFPAGTLKTGQFGAILKGLPRDPAL
jgi:hypothetical protein